MLEWTFTQFWILLTPIIKEKCYLWLARYRKLCFFSQWVIKKNRFKIKPRVIRSINFQLQMKNEIEYWNLKQFWVIYLHHMKLNIDVSGQSQLRFVVDWLNDAQIKGQTASFAFDRLHSGSQIAADEVVAIIFSWRAGLEKKIQKHNDYLWMIALINLPCYLYSDSTHKFWKIVNTFHRFKARLCRWKRSILKFSSRQNNLI